MPGGGHRHADVLTRSQRMVLGVMLLITVDVIWVASSEFTGILFHDLDYDKPFFSTYFKTSLFMVYLFGFLTYRPWQEQCAQWSVNDAAGLRRYQRISSNADDEEGPDQAGDAPEQAEEASLEDPDLPSHEPHGSGPAAAAYASAQPRTEK